MSETATLVHAAPRGKNTRIWLGAVLLVVLLFGGAAGFYAYRARQQAQQISTQTTDGPAQPAASTQPEKTSEIDSVQVDQPKTDESKIEKKADANPRTVTSKQPLPKTDASKPAKDFPIPPDTAHDPQRNPDRNPRVEPPAQAPSIFDPFRNRQGRQPGHPPGTGEGRQMPNIRTFPNGSRVVTQPDGTRVLTMPNGETRVFPPGAKPIRKRNRP